MKLIMVIVNSEDSNRLVDKLAKNKVRVTKLASTGGFLMSGNTTFMICADDEKVDAIIEIITERSRRRKQYVPAANIAGAEMHGGASFPVEVSVGGATIFVTDVERFEKV